MARVLKGSHSFTCTPRVHPLTKWTIPVFSFPAEAGTHLPTPEGWKAELALGGWLVTYWNRCPPPGLRLSRGLWQSNLYRPTLLISQESQEKEDSNNVYSSGSLVLRNTTQMTTAWSPSFAIQQCKLLRSFSLTLCCLTL